MFFGRREFLKKALKIMTSGIIILVTSKKTGDDLPDVYIDTMRNLAIWRK